jgi:hypothetical protein
MTHCWKDYRTHLEETGRIYSDEWAATYWNGDSTCMREAGHEGDHEFVDDNSIVVQFKDVEV